MKTLFRALSIFFLLLVATSIMMDSFKMEFGTINYWDKHGVFFLIFITLFPRLTLLFSSVAFGGFFWWLGFIFFPRILVASLATVAYFHTNPILVVISWIIALGGEVFEKWGIGRNKVFIRTYRQGPRSTYEHVYEKTEQKQHSISEDGVIEAEFTKKD